MGKEEALESGGRSQTVVKWEDWDTLVNQEAGWQGREIKAGGKMEKSDRRRR